MILPNPSVHPKRRRVLFLQAFALLRHPINSWAWIEADDEGPWRLLAFYAAPLALAPILARAVGLYVFGGRDPRGPFKLTPFGVGLDALLGYGLSLLALGVLCLLASLTARLTRSKGRRSAGARLAIYGSTAGWVGGVFSLSPYTRFLGVLWALYGIVLFAAGARAIVRPAKGALVGYVVIVLAGFAAANALIAGGVRLFLNLI